jgi:hypothetical protein
MDHGTGSRLPSRGTLNRIAAAAIILLTANIATLILPGPVSARPLGTNGHQILEH